MLTGNIHSIACYLPGAVPFSTLQPYEAGTVIPIL